MNARAALVEVRNPLLVLPEVVELMDSLDDAQAERWHRALWAIKRHCVEKEREAYRKRKGPMTAYWMAVGTYCKHLANVIRRTQRDRQPSLELAA